MFQLRSMFAMCLPRSSAGYLGLQFLDFIYINNDQNPRLATSRFFQTPQATAGLNGLGFVEVTLCHVGLSEIS